ncbi:MAG TPA: tetratricopeptide repeat protein [Myxococcales bacterium]|nr:tetratricopeptide repeat protein [Myxococcales bacterium]HIM00056.1 tetratricopeptide repeat protein [Myxococcales bacterium]
MCATGRQWHAREAIRYVPPMSELPDSAGRIHTWLGSLVIVVACFVVYSPSLGGGFVWDDDTHLLLNPVFQEDGLRRVWFEPPQEINYWPVTFTTYWLEYQLWEFDPLGYRVVNILLHALAAIVLWAVLRALQIPFSWWIAFVFAIHPVNVESVAWIAQRKNILSMLFSLIAALLFLRFEATKKASTYVSSVVSFLIAMLSKGAAAPFPAALLLLAWWRRRVITRRDVLLSLPFFLVTIATSLLEISTQILVADDVVVRDDSFMSRLAGAGWVVWFYLGKVLWPANLTFVYPRWEIDATSALSWVPLLAGALLLATAWRARSGWGRPVWVALTFYILMLSPVLGFFNIYYMRFSFVADHYQYIAMIGIVTLVVGGVGDALRKAPGLPKFVAPLLGATLIAFFGANTMALSASYESAEILWLETLEKNPDAFLAHYNLAQQLHDEDRLEEAALHYREALRVQPRHAESMNNLGKLLQDQGKSAQAIREYQRAIETSPSYLDPQNNLAILFQQDGRTDEARAQFQRALETAPDSGVVHFNFSRFLDQTGDPRSALSHYRQAAALMPRDPRIQTALREAIRRGEK